MSRRAFLPLRILCAAILAGAFLVLAGCGDGPEHGVPYQHERYSSNNGPYHESGGSQEEWGLFSHGHSEHSDYDDGRGNGMTYSSSSHSSHFP